MCDEHPRLHRDPKVFGQHFKGGTFDAWLAFLAALFALPMTAEQLAIYRKHTGRTDPPTQPAKEAWLVVGRRGGKSFILAVIAVFLACFKDWRGHLAAGEHGTLMIIAEDRKQCRAIMRFIRGLLHGAPMLRRTIVNETTKSVTLKNRIVIEVHLLASAAREDIRRSAASGRESACGQATICRPNPTSRCSTHIRPGMATIPDAMLLCASSPHGQRGALWDATGSISAPTPTTFWCGRRPRGT